MLKIAGIQASCSPNKESNLTRAINLARLAMENGARLICFTQLFYLPWFPCHIEEKNFALAEDLQSEAIRRLQALAKEGEAALVCPVFEKTAAGNYYNSAVIIDSDGEILGRYRKMHIPDLPLWRERFYFEEGDLGFPVFETAYARIGVQLCWDAFYPEGFRILALKGAQIVFCPTAAAYATQQRWKKVIYGHAISNNLYIMRVNRVGKEAKQTFYGNSFCVTPQGELLEETAAGEQSLLLCDLELQEVELLRRQWAFFQSRRPESYQEISRLAD